MHGKLLIAAGLAVSAGTVAAAIDLSDWVLPRPVRPVPTRLDLRNFQVAPRRPPATMPILPLPRMEPLRARDVEPVPLLRTVDGRAVNLPWRRGTRDSAAAGAARDSMAALLAPGRRQLACDLENQPRAVRLLSLLVVDQTLIRFRLVRALSGDRLNLRPSGYLLEMDAEPLRVQRVREMCRPLGELP